MARMFTYVDQDTYDAINKIAEKEHLSSSSLISSILKSYIKEINYEDVDNTEDIDNEEHNNTSVQEVKKMRVWIDEDTVPVLIEKATSVGLSNAVYIRNLIHTKDFKIIRVGTNDIEELIDEVHRSNSLIMNCVSLIRKHGLEASYKNEVDEIVQNSGYIKKLLTKTLATLYSNRKTAQQKMIDQSRD